MILVGADPEVFLKDRNTETILSAIDKIGGTKENPRPVLKGAVQEDNILAEFNINPAGTHQEFTDNIQTVMGQLDDIAALNNMTIHIKASHNFTKKELQNFGPEAFVFGCDPEYSAYSGKMIKSPSPDKTVRSAAGHVHVGYEDPTEERNKELVKLLDCYLGLPSVVIDDDSQRRKMYGKAGSMRNKPYGVEYRTLSNFWLKSKELQQWVFETTKEVSEKGFEDLTELYKRVKHETDKKGQKVIKKIINNNNAELAFDLCNKLNIRIP